MRLVLDTCTVIFAVAAPERLTAAARGALTTAGAQLLVSPISCAEVACAVERGRLQLDRHWRSWFRHYVSSQGWEVVPIDLSIVEEAYALQAPFHKDPADRVIVATTRLYADAVVTADEKIRDYPHVTSVW